MMQARLQQMGRLGVVLVWCVACNGQIHNLGDETAAGGPATLSNGGSAATLGNGGSAATFVYGVAGDGTRVQIGDNTSSGGASWTEKPYVQLPSLPIDPTCTCTDATKICNAARQCVDRCDKDGRCALWLTDHAVNDLFVEGSTVYYLQSPSTDPLGNKETNGSLYRVEYPSGKQTRIATDLGDPQEIVGRYQNATYIMAALEDGSYVPVRVADSGNVTVLDTCAPYRYCPNASLRGHWLAYASSQRLSLIDLDVDEPTPQVLVEVQATANVQVLRDQLWFHYNDTEWCHFDLAALTQEPTCETLLLGIVTLSSDEELYGFGRIEPTSSILDSYNVRTQKSRTLFNQNVSYGRPALANGFIYLAGAFEPTRLVRFPTAVGRLPQDVLPAEIADPNFTFNPTEPYGYAVSSDALYWFQSVKDRNQGQYIFRAPLPPQPCDSELPCADSGQACSNGLCVPPQ